MDNPIENRKIYPLNIFPQWKRVLSESTMRPISDETSVTEFNTHVNNSYDYIYDGKKDVWISPDYFESRGGGDCEDSAIYKYFSLPYPRYIAVGLLPNKEAHAVLVIYAQEFGEWVVLDNITDDIIPWEQYKERFNAIYFCDKDGVYL